MKFMMDGQKFKVCKHKHYKKMFSLLIKRKFFFKNIFLATHLYVKKKF